MLRSGSICARVRIGGQDFAHVLVDVGEVQLVFARPNSATERPDSGEHVDAAVRDVCGEAIEVESALRHFGVVFASRQVGRVCDRRDRLAVDFNGRRFRTHPAFGEGIAL